MVNRAASCLVVIVPCILVWATVPGCALDGRDADARDWELLPNPPVGRYEEWARGHLEPGSSPVLDILGVRSSGRYLEIDFLWAGPSGTTDTVQARALLFAFIRGNADPNRYIELRDANDKPVWLIGPYAEKPGDWISGYVTELAPSGGRPVAAVSVWFKRAGAAGAAPLASYRLSDAWLSTEFRDNGMTLAPESIGTARRSIPYVAASEPG